MEIKERILSKIKELNNDAIVEVSEHLGDLAITLKEENLLEVARMLKEDPELNFRLIEDVTAIDWAKRKERFTVVYHIYSLTNNFRLRLKVNLEGTEVDSLVPVWKGAEWYERETFDMYGIKFKGNPDLRRMYMPEEFEYHPLRKEFPVLGIPGSLPLPKKD
ncbi:MAG: NADH-quinone oxidoreductase subunit C [Ignavibacteria bacterium]|nr:MAG: NADH-quinone oxidoreductase subunit C [Ignavibacteria bacterium]